MACLGSQLEQLQSCAETSSVEQTTSPKFLAKSELFCGTHTPACGALRHGESKEGFVDLSQLFDHRFPPPGWLPYAEHLLVVQMPCQRRRVRPYNKSAATLSSS